MAGIKEQISGLELPEEVKRWWESVQTALTEAGCRLSLENPADLARLFVATHEKKGYDQYEVKTRYAFDPMRREIDVNTIREEEILARQVTDGPELKGLLEEIYRQAQEGCLFIRSMPGENALPRQLLAGEDGLARVGNDIDHPSPEEQAYTRLIDEPELPEAPAESVREKAAAGDPSAQFLVRTYEEKLAGFSGQQEDWRRFQDFVGQRPQFYRQCRNMVITFRHYLEDTKKEFEEYTRKLESLHKQAEYDKLPEEERRVVMNRERQSEAFGRELSEFWSVWNNRKMRYGAWGPGLSEAFAGLLVSRKELRRGEEALKSGSSRDFVPLSREETEQAVREMQESRPFRQLLRMIDQDTLGDILGEGAKPAEARKRLEDFCDGLLTPEGREALRTGWWGKLQEALNRGGCELDLNSPEDLSRLLIFDVRQSGNGSYDTIPYFAADPEKRPIDLNLVTEEQMKAASRPGVPDGETMERILEAAYEGRLFVCSHKEAKKPALPRPVLLGNTSRPEVGGDVNSFTERETEAVRVLAAPEAPEAPDAWDRIKARFGNAGATERLATYQRRQAAYERDVAAWEQIRRSDARFVTQVRNRYLIGQTFFGNFMQNGRGLLRYEEMTGRLHRQSEVRKIPENSREAAEDILRCRERIVRLARSAADRRKKNADPKAALSQEELVLVSQLEASRRELARAKRCMGAPGFRAKTEEEIQADAADLRRQKSFALLGAQLKGSFSEGLIQNAYRGEAEALRYLDSCMDRAYAKAAEDPEWRQLRDSLLPRTEKSGEQNDTSRDERGYYSKEVENYVSDSLGRYLNALAPGEQLFSPGSDIRIDEAQAEFLRTHGREFAESMAADPLSYTGKYSEKAVSELLARMKPDYKPLTAAERESRRENSRLIREKFNRHLAGQSMAAAITMRGGVHLDRPFQGVLATGTDPAAMLYNENLRRILTEGSLREKRDLYMDTLRRISETDLSGIDVTDDQNLVENFERLAPVMSAGVEIVNLLSGARALGIDLTGDEYRPMIEKLGILADTAYMIRAKVDCMSHPMYGEIRYEELAGSYRNLTSFDAEGEDIDIYEFFEERGENNRAASASIDQIGMVVHLADRNPLFDTKLSPEERERRYRENFWNSRKEVMPEKPAVVFRRGELLEDTEDHYNDFAEDGEIEELEEPVTSETLLRELSAEAALQPEKKAGTLPEEQEGPAAREAFPETEAYYREIREHPENALAREGAGDVREQEALFAEGLVRTDALRAETERLAALPIPETEEEFRLAVCSRMLEAREKLTQMVGRDNIAAEELLRPMAELVQGRKALEFCKTKENGFRAYETLVRQAEGDAAFRQLLSGMKSGDINRFLAGPGEETLAEDYRKAQKAAAGIREEQAAEGPDEPLRYDKGLRQLAYEELRDRLAEALHDRLGETYGKLEQTTGLSRHRMQYVLVEDRSLAAIFNEEHEKIEPKDRPVKEDGKSLTNSEMLDRYGFARAESLLAEALLSGKQISYFTADPVTARINAAFPLPLRLSDFDREVLPQLGEAERKAALETAGEKQDPKRSPEEAARRRAENESLMRELDYFCGLEENSIFSVKTKRAYFGGLEKESGLKVADLKTKVVGTNSRGGVSSLAVSAMVCSGYKIEDIFDPAKLLKEKDEFGREAVARLLADDVGWVTDVNMRARDILSADMLRRAEKVDFTDPNSIYTEENQIMAQEAMLCFDLRQNINNEYTRAEMPEWYRKNCGNLTPEEKERDLDARSMTAASFIGHFFIAQKTLLEAAAGINTQPLQNGFSRDLAGRFIEQRRRENPGKSIAELIRIEDQTILAPDNWLDTTSPEAARTLRQMKRRDSAALAKSILNGSLLKQYEVSFMTAENYVMPVLAPGKRLTAEPVPEQRAPGRTAPAVLAPVAEEEDETIDREFGERMEKYRNGIGTLTEKQRLEELRRVNEDLKAAGVKPMTEEEMAARAADPGPVREYLTAAAFDGTLRRATDYIKNCPHKVHPALARATGWLFDPSGTPEAEERNGKLAEKLRTVEDVNRVIRESFRMMTEYDESRLFTHSLPEMIAAFGDDPRKLQLCYELNHIMDTVGRVKKGNGETELNLFGLSPEEYTQLKEKYQIFENGSGFEGYIRMASSPERLFFPELSPDDAVKLSMYYKETGQQEKYAFVERTLDTVMDRYDDKYMPCAAKILKNQGFLGKQEPGVFYETYDEKGTSLGTRKRGIKQLSDGSAESIRFVKTVKQPGGVTETEELVLRRDDVLRLYDREHLDERLAAAYRPLSPVIFTSDPALLREQEAAASKGLPVKKIIFGGDPLVLEARKAALLYQLEVSDEFKKADRQRQEELYQKWTGEIADGKNGMVNFLCSQPREMMDAMVYDLACSKNSIRRSFVNRFNEIENLREDTARKQEPAEAYIRGMFLPKTDSSAVRLSFYDYRTGGQYIDSAQLKAQQEADAIVLPLPAGLSGENVTAAAMAFFFTRENMAESFRLSLNGAGSSQFSYADPGITGLGNVLQPVFRTNEVRENNHKARLFLPEARKNAKAALEKYERGDCTDLVKAADASLRFMVRGYNFLTARDSDQVLEAGRIITGLYDLLSRPELAPQSEALQEIPEQWIGSLKQDAKLNRERAELKEELLTALQQRMLDREYLGKDPEAEGSFAEAATLREKLLDYEARRLYFTRLADAGAVFDEAAGIRFGGDTREKFEAMQQRPLTRPQKNMLQDPEAYLSYLKEQILAGEEPAFGRVLQAKTWEEAYRALQSERSSMTRDKTYNISVSERWGMATAVRRFLREAEPDPKLQALTAELRALPCLQDPEETAELTAEEMLRRAGIYETLAERVRGTGVNRVGGEQQGFAEVIDASGELADKLLKEARLLQGSAGLAAREKSYENRAAEKQLELKGRGGLSFEEAEQRIRRAGEARDRVLREYEQPGGQEMPEIDPWLLNPEGKQTALRYGRATRESYLKRITDLIREAPEEISSCAEFRKASAVIGGIAAMKLRGFRIRPEHQALFEETCDGLGTLAEKTAEKMADDDSAELLEKAAYITNLSALVDAYRDTPELTEAARAENSRYQSAYDHTVDREADIDRIIAAEKRLRESRGENGPVSEYMKLAQLAKGSMARIREAVAAEAYGQRSEGIAALKESDDIAILSLFSVLSKAPRDSAIRKRLEQDGVALAVHTADRMPMIMARRQELTLEKLHQGLAVPDGFRAYMAPEPRRQDRNPEQKPQLRKAEKKL